MADNMGGTHRKLGVAIAAAVFVLDQFSKWVVTHLLQLPIQREIELLPIFALRWVKNPGVSMGYFTADTNVGRWLLVGFTVLIAGFVSVWMWREKSKQDCMALGLVLGGALGNILDRARLGYVVDFADLHFGEFSPFLVFNVGDAAITIGVLLLVARALLTSEPKPRKEV